MDLRKLIIDWDNKHPLDREYRKKYNIAFNSSQHRAISQIDVYLEFLEDKLHHEAFERAKDQILRDEDYKKGIWLREAILADSEFDAAWDKMDISTIPKDSPIQFE